MQSTDNNSNNSDIIQQLMTENVDLRSQLKEVTDREKIATNLNSRTSNLIEELANVSLQGIIVLGKKNIEFCNDRARELNGVPRRILDEGMPWLNFFQFQMDRGDFGEGLEAQEFFDALLANFKNREIMQVERKAGDGRTIRADRIPNSIGGMTLTLTDITELKEREAQLEISIQEAKSSDIAKSNFLANMSHEIRTPMNGVMGMAELLAATKLDQKQEMFTNVIVKSGNSLLTIINDILDFSKIDAGQMALDPAPFVLVEAIEDVATLVSTGVSEKDLELIVRVDPALPKMMIGDVGRIRQIVLNLLGNAVKFTDIGHVLVNIEGVIQDEEYGDIAGLKVSIEDTGMGIPKEQCSQVFEKFNQVDTSATRKHEGTGLGLSISASLVQLMGGEIGVESEFGKGSTFWFTIELPVYNDDELKTIEQIDAAGARVLVIDDNPVNRSILDEQLDIWNFDGASASSGAEGLDIMRAVAAKDILIDLVILDYQMPSMSGAKVLESMRNDQLLKNIPVVMLTSVDDAQTNKQLQNLGAEANLTKPVRSSILQQTILNVIASKRADNSNRNLISDSTEDRSVYDRGISIETTSTPSSQKSTLPIDNNQMLDVLVAEDNAVNQIVFHQILTEMGVRFKIVENGGLAFEAFKSEQPRLILMDVSMPELNGKDTTTEIRKYEKVFDVSAYGTD